MTNINVNFIIFPAMILAGNLYFDAMSKIGEIAAVSPVSRELGKFPCCPLFWDKDLQTVEMSLSSEIVVYFTWVSGECVICCQ